ncbi:unnamed protein product [Prorocentrum cordatum]|uniref:Ion transport domain-containing protein n=1 Tax=Prorocentrum cordatum TaxID=2364126 RepID=A0ABN9USQ0_9DINO|nr:unnamed protein product [Polarella glacialis]
MAATGMYDQLRVTLADERSRLGKVLDQVDDALKCLEHGSILREFGEQYSERSMDVIRRDTVPSSEVQQEVSGKSRSGIFRRAATQSTSKAWESKDEDKEKAKLKFRASRTSVGPMDAVVASAPRPVVAPMASTGDRSSKVKRSITGMPRNAVIRGAIPRVFANADQMKEQVQQAILQPDYDVKDMYKDEGWFQAVARSSIFDSIGLCVIMLNALWLAVETDYNDEALLVNAAPPFIIVENLFCTFFCFELFVRFMAFQVKLHVFKDSWFMFDFVIVFFMAFETWGLSFLVWVTNGALTASSSSTSVLRVVRLFRLTRAPRVARLLKSVPEMMVIVHGIVIVARTVVVIGCLLALIIYTFAIVFTQLAKGTELESTLCPDMMTTMKTLLIGGIFPDIEPTIDAMADEHFLFGLFFFVFVLLAYVMIMNMLIGVLVEVISVVAAVEKEKNQVAAVKRVLLKWAPEADIGGDNMFGVNEFKHMLNTAGCAKDLNDVGVDAVALVDHADFIYRNKDELTFSELLAVLLGLRGGNDPKVQDLVQLRKFLHVEMQRIEMSVDSLHKVLSTQPQGSKDLSLRDKAPEEDEEHTPLV